MRILATCFLISLYAFSYAQNTEKDTSLSCIAKWKKGEEKVLLISRHKESYESGKRSSIFDFSYEAHVSVLDSSKEGYTIKWVFHLTEEFKQANPGIAGSMPVYEGLKMIFTTAPTGAFKELINWEEVKDAYVAMMEVSIPEDLDDTVKASLNKAKALFDSREMVESALIKEIQLYHAAYGGEFSTKGQTAKTSLPNPLGPEPMPATVTQKMKEINPGSDNFIAIITQEIDTQSATKLIEGLLNKMNMPNDTAIIKAKEMLSTFDIKDTCEFLITQSTGWILRLNSQRTATISEMKQTESFKFEMK
jgi:hypothetical protein